ncbi:MAG: hypothetical protein DA408_02075 [Bacteroidetes bacterium]|nr:MAG: hypothetical protein C7N36_14585 [Bacteroidota bacterium]PTM14601.1 MAG: hypothetical protein DA408_02075 [Bacteroidota bacterium]
MNIKLSQYFGVVALLLLVFSLSAQDSPSIFMNNKDVEPGETVEFDVFVKGYTEIISTAFVINWDSLMLRYVGVDNIALGLSVDDNFNASNATGGKLTYLYFDNSLAGNSLLDNEVLFTLRLEAIGSVGSVTNVDFGGLMEVVDTSETALTVDFVGSVVNIGVVSAAEVARTAFTAAVSPNPFAGNAQVLLELPQGGTVNWTLSQTNGQLIGAGEANLAPGKQTLELNNTLFKQSGSYILKLQLGDTVLTKRLISVDR